MAVPTADTAAALGAESPRHRRQDGDPARLWRGLASKVLLPLVAVVALLVVLAYAVFPTRTWLDQRSAIESRRLELAEIGAANADLATRRDALLTEAEIERIARRDHGLIRPGEEAYAVLPAAPPAVKMPQAWPFTDLARAVNP